MWAITDFRKENGATKIVPGSHRWDAERAATPGEVVAAEMDAGDMLVWMGGTLYGAGANTTDDSRYGLFLSYSLGWLRQEKNQYANLPLRIAKTYPKEIRDLMGYAMHNGLGFYDRADPSPLFP
jgi:ectoine hydroxylase-related dioxygenase (phytanoyl-CoA dioxygenase family)